MKTRILALCLAAVMSLLTLASCGAEDVEETAAAPVETAEETMADLYEKLSPGYITGLTLLGGEPMEPANQQALLPFVEEVRRRFPQKTIWCYTGYTYETDLLSPAGRAHCAVTDKLLGMMDVLVDGRFVQDLHDITLLFRGSSNQRLIDLACTRQAGSVVLWENRN